MNKKTKQLALDKIAGEIVEQKICPELATNATRLVFGEGSPDAEIVFVGEAPGKKEDETGLPFVGAAGKLLNEMLEKIGLKRSDIYITNIVKYRPPGNRDPMPEEKAAFMPFLRAQLETIKPKIVATLGRHSLNSFLPALSISTVHGQPKRVKIALSKAQDELTLIILPLYHPAAALYNGGLRQTLFDDFSKIPKIINNIKTTI